MGLVQGDETAPPKGLIRAGVLPTLLRFGEMRPLELEKEDKAEQRSGLQENKGTQDKKKVEIGQKTKGSLERQVRGDPGTLRCMETKASTACV